MSRFVKALPVRDVILSPEMSSVLAKGFVEDQGCVLFASEAHNATHTRVSYASDETGYECFINHVHIKSLQEALAFAQQLTKVLAEGFTDRFVVIVSFDGRDATVRFHKFRAGQTWLTDNLEKYKEEGIAVFDSH
jgi:Uri superfamily endonuclease